MIIIPAIDIYEKQIVRLKEGDFSRVTFYGNSPLEQAKVFKNHGFSWLHIVDLSASKTGNITTLDIVEEIKLKTGMNIEFGGGIRSGSSVEKILSAGADRVIIGSLSVQNKAEFEEIVQRHDPGRIVIAADVKDEKIAIKGWTEQTSLSLSDHIEYCLGLGIDTFLCTDISKDGMLEGTNTGLYSRILKKYPGIKLIASGGVKDIEDVKRVKDLDVYGVVVGKAIYENKINLKELAEVGK
ncbi:MAG: 1-(5-phosphoribosyl)-5-[(5-phosphoribosylamino)methylideneamino]imidazole-4-carboxamide isomerase [Ignavibacteriales bacterium]